MNSDQLNSLVRTGLKMLGALLVAHGWTATAGVLNADSIAGALIALLGLALSHFAHKADPAPPADPPAGGSGDGSVPIKRATGITSAPLMSLLAVGLLAAPLALTEGCSTTPQRAAYQSVATTEVSVEAAVNEWNAYVAAAHPPLAQQQAVRAAWQKYQAAMLLVCDAGAAYSAAGSTNSAGATGASAALQQAITNAGQTITDLEYLITQFKGTP
jgi:hypothetical protein